MTLVRERPKNDVGFDRGKTKECRMDNVNLADTVDGATDMNQIDDKMKVSLSSLSEMTGFPVDFIKKELLLENEPVSMHELRQSVLRYLETTAADFQA